MGKRKHGETEDCGHDAPLIKVQRCQYLGTLRTVESLIVGAQVVLSKLCHCHHIVHQTFFFDALRKAQNHKRRTSS